jgi:hypothetical protein
LPRGLIDIGAVAFRGCGIWWLDLSETDVRRIGLGAFSRCRELRDVSLPPALEKLGPECFSECGLTAVDVTVLPPGALDAEVVNRSSAVSSVSRLREVGVRFAFCNAVLARVDLSSTMLVRVKSSAFEACRALRKVVFPASLEELGDRCLAGTGLRSLDLAGTQVRVV